MDIGVHFDPPKPPLWGSNRFIDHSDRILPASEQEEGKKNLRKNFSHHMAAASPELPILSRRQNRTPVNGALHQTGEVGQRLRTAGSVSGGTSPRSCTGPPPSRPPPPPTTTCPPSPLSSWLTTATSISPSPRPKSPRPTTEEEESG